MGFFGVPLSGLVASEAQLQTVSNNLANLDTVGYKDQSTSFSDLFAQSSATNGVGDPLQQGLGVVASQTVSNFTSGLPTSTGVNSNMAISGNGFFVVQNASGGTDYTRAGDFTTNTKGQLTDPNGNLVMGYPAVNGVVSTASPLQPLTINQGQVIPASATTSFNFSLNLDAAPSTTGAASTYSNTTQVFDSLGNPQELSINYTNTGPNTWSYSVNVPTSATGAASSQVASGSLTFNSSGQLVSPTGSIALSIPSLSDGAAPMNISWNLDDGSGNPTLTQTSAASGMSNLTQNGYASGTLSDYTVSSNGTIEGSFTNGQNIALGQVALANFANPQGLSQVGGNAFQSTYAAGVAQVGTAGTGGLGTVTGGSIEASNVDVATEFGKMIVAQQAYQANAKTITTMDQLVQTTMQMLSA
jgi:flagellar hook protein FlgE